MRTTMLVPAGSVPLTGATAAAGAGVLASGRITFSVLRCKIGRSESWSELELESALRSVGPLFESELELSGALRKVGSLEYPPEFRPESPELPLNSMR